MWRWQGCSPKLELKFVILKCIFHDRLNNKLRVQHSAERGSHIHIRYNLILVSLLVHFEELIRAVSPGLFCIFYTSPVTKLLLKRVVVGIFCRVEVSRLVKSLVVHRKFFDPLLGIQVADLSLRVHHNFIHGVPVRSQNSWNALFGIVVSGEVPAQKNKACRQQEEC